MKMSRATQRPGEVASKVSSEVSKRSSPRSGPRSRTPVQPRIHAARRRGIAQQLRLVEAEELIGGSDGLRLRLVGSHLCCLDPCLRLAGLPPGLDDLKFRRRDPSLGRSNPSVCLGHVLPRRIGL